jgi:hypothetical protein
LAYMYRKDFKAPVNGSNRKFGISLFAKTLILDITFV